MNISNKEWVEFVFNDLPSGVAPVYAAFEDDPETLSEVVKGQCFRGRGIGEQWGGYGIVVYRDVAAEINTYVNVASFKVNPANGRLIDGKGRASYWGLHAVFIDDVFKKVYPPIPGDGEVGWLEPTLKIETSADNQQWWYVFEEPVLGYDLAKQFTDAWVGAVNNDARGPTRWGRLPVGANTKGCSKVNGRRPYQHQVVGGSMKKFDKEELISGFQLKLAPIVERRARMQEEPMTRLEEIDKKQGMLVAEWLRVRGMVKMEHDDSMEIVCPLGGHDNGPGTRFWLPSPDNNWRGGFKCQHLKCMRKGLGDLINWVKSDVRDFQSHKSLLTVDLSDVAAHNTSHAKK